jgi:Secretion system C-terminal sorting domain
MQKPSLRVRTKSTLLYLFILFVGITFGKQQLWAQSQCDTSYVIQTGIQDAAWAPSPINTQRPVMTNSFRWTSQNYNWRTSLHPTVTSIASPFFQPFNSNVGNLLAPLDTLAREFRPEDGWELIKMDLGFYADGTPIPTGSVNPSVILYNKYTGILRVFVARGELFESANRALIRVGFPTSPNISGTIQTSTFDLSLGNGPKALDNSFFKKDSSFFYSPVNYIDDLFKWMYADFSIVYDPCTCFYKSLMQVKVDLIKNTSINLKGALNGKIETIQNYTSTQTDGEYNKFRKIYGNISTIARKFIEGANGVEDFRKKYTKTVDSSKGGTVAQKSEKKSALLNFAIKLANGKFAKSGINAVPGLKVALDIMDFFVGGGKEEKGPQPIELMPMSINMDLTVTGSLQTETNKLDYQLLMPGSISTGISNEFYPYYNNALGVFNIMNTPRINFAISTEFIPAPIRGGGYLNTIRHYQFATPINYTLNPGAGLEIAKDSATGKDDIQVSLVIPRGIPVGDNTTPWPAYGSSNAKWNYHGRNDKEQTDEFGSDYSFSSCIGDTVYAILQTNNPVEPYLTWPRLVDKAYIKVIVNLKRKSGIGQNVIYMAKYPVNIDTLASVDEFRIPLTTCDNQLFVKASDSYIQNFCTSPGSIYVNSERTLRRANTVWDTDETKPKNRLFVSGGSKVMPNPVANRLTILLNHPYNRHISLFITDALGRQVIRLDGIQTMIESSTSLTADVSKLAPGLYFLTIKNSQTGIIELIKFVKAGE